MKLTVELEREDDGRWIAEVVKLPGVMIYGETRGQAIAAVERLAVQAVADRIAHNELPPSCFNLSFTVPNEQMAGV